MKIGIDIRLIGKKRTGDEAVVFNLVKNLARLAPDKHEFSLFTDVTDSMALKGIGESLGIVEKENFKIVSLPTKNRFAWNFWILPRHLAQNPVDVFHTQYITPWFVSKKIKIVTIVHDISFNFFPQFIKFSDLLFLKILIPLSLRRADKIVAVSQFTQSEIINYYNVKPEKIAWIHNAISEDFLKQVVSVEKLPEISKKYGLPAKFILYLGTLQPRKNVPSLLEAFAQIKEQVGELNLVICGNKKAGNYDVRIDEVIEKLKLEDRVFFPGFVDEDDKKAIFALAQVFAFPSLYEGFGIPVLEAMSQEVPVVCSDIPSLKEVAADGAMYFEVGSLDNFSKKLYDVCMDKNLRSELILKGKERISFFSWQKSAQKMLTIYEEVGSNGEIKLKN